MKKATAATKGLYTRGNIYYVRKVIPAHLREIAGKREFLVSLKTDNYQTAILKYSDVKENIDYAISAMKDGTYQKEVLDFDHYSKIAAANGRQLQCLKEILPDPTKVSALVQQIKAADKNKELSKHEIKSYINVKNSDIKLSKLPEIYIEAKKLELKDYNDRERARKIDPLKNACKQLQTF